MKLKVVQTAKSLGLDNTFFSARRTYHYEERSLWYQTCSLGFPDSSIGKESACNAGDPGSIPPLGRSAREAYHDSRAKTRSPSPCAWRPDFPDS